MGRSQGYCGPVAPKYCTLMCSNCRTQRSQFSRDGERSYGRSCATSTMEFMRLAQSTLFTRIRQQFLQAPHGHGGTTSHTFGPCAKSSATGHSSRAQWRECSSTAPTLSRTTHRPLGISGKRSAPTVCATRDSRSSTASTHEPMRFPQFQTTPQRFGLRSLAASTVGRDTKSSSLRLSSCRLPSQRRYTCHSWVEARPAGQILKRTFGGAFQRLRDAARSPSTISFRTSTLCSAPLMSSLRRARGRSRSGGYRSRQRSQVYRQSQRITVAFARRLSMA